MYRTGISSGSGVEVVKFAEINWGDSVFVWDVDEARTDERFFLGCFFRFGGVIVEEFGNVFPLLF